jgi:hypothetical protein
MTEARDFLSAACGKNDSEKKKSEKEWGLGWGEVQGSFKKGARLSA